MEISNKFRNMLEQIDKDIKFIIAKNEELSEPILRRVLNISRILHNEDINYVRNKISYKKKAQQLMIKKYNTKSITELKEILGKDCYIDILDIITNAMNWVVSERMLK